MIRYKITFEFDMESDLDYDKETQDVEILELDDECFDKSFDNLNKIKEFQDEYNNGTSNEDEKVSIINIIYDRAREELGILEVSLESELKDEKTFADELVYYLFEGDSPKVYYHVYGKSYKDYWDYRHGSPEQREVIIDYDDSADLTSYVNVNIRKI